MNWNPILAISGLLIVVGCVDGTATVSGLHQTSAMPTSPTPISAHLTPGVSGNQTTNQNDKMSLRLSQGVSRQTTANGDSVVVRVEVR